MNNVQNCFLKDIDKRFHQRYISDRVTRLISDQSEKMLLSQNNLVILVAKNPNPVRGKLHRFLKCTYVKASKHIL